MPVIDSPLERKLRYVQTLASVEGIDLSMRRWAARLEEIYLAIGFNVFFRFFLDMYLNLNLHFDFEQFEWHPVKFTEEVTVEGQPLEEVQKARYGISKYDESIYDPEQVSPQHLERMVWDWRRHTTVIDEPTWKLTSESIKKYISSYKDMLVAKDVMPEYVDAMEDTLAYVEGKVLDSAYWDMAIWDISPWKETMSVSTIFKPRLSTDWKSQADLETEFPYDNQWDFCRWDYARWYETGLRLEEELVEHLDKAIKDFQARAGLVEQYGVKVLYQRVFMLQRVDRYHWIGGGHQIKLQDIILRVKQILDRRGVISSLRMGYIAFAKEIAYLYHEGHRKFKHYKKMLTREDIKNKYIRMGFDKEILEEIEKVIP